MWPTEAITHRTIATFKLGDWRWGDSAVGRRLSPTAGVCHVKHDRRAPGRAVGTTIHGSRGPQARAQPSLRAGATPGPRHALHGYRRDHGVARRYHVGRLDRDTPDRAHHGPHAGAGGRPG